jgi:hypothetical protein
VKKSFSSLISVLLLPAAAQAQGLSSVMVGFEAHIGLILLIASGVIIALMILMLFYLHGISDHLNWIRRIR